MNTIIQTPTNDLAKSVDFYKKLQFTILSEADTVLLTDGNVMIEINPDRFARAGVKLYKDSWAKEVYNLKNYTTVLKNEQGYLLSDPSGTWIYLLESEAPSLDHRQAKPSVLGNFAGLSLETVDMQRAVEIWQLLGFPKSMGSMEQGWLSFKNADNVTVSIMKPNACPHLFFNPSLTYFNGKENPDIIQKVRDLSIPISEEITAFNKEGMVDNIIIRDPGGYGFFIFND